MRVRISKIRHQLTGFKRTQGGGIKKQHLVFSLILKWPQCQSHAANVVKNQVLNNSITLFIKKIDIIKHFTDQPQLNNSFLKNCGKLCTSVLDSLNNSLTKGKFENALKQKTLSLEWQYDKYKKGNKCSAAMMLLLQTVEIIKRAYRKDINIKKCKYI